MDALYCTRCAFNKTWTQDNWLLHSGTRSTLHSTTWIRNNWLLSSYANFIQADDFSTHLTMNAQQQVENELINQDTWLPKMINVVRYTFTRTLVQVMDRERFLSHELNTFWAQTQDITCTVVTWRSTLSRDKGMKKSKYKKQHMYTKEPNNFIY